MQTNNFLGYYKTNGQIFTDKLSCILEAQKTLSDITWHFNDDVFQKVNWNIEPQLTLDEYYKLRAQQIRDRFDYVIIMCSGGADSTNVLYSFLNNNIRVDEIVSGAPLSGLKNWNFNDKDYSANNTISETKFALFPLLNKVASHHPSIKITINDWFEDVIQYKTDEWLYNSGDWISPTSACDRSLDKFKHLVDLAESGKKIAVVYGIDKPMIRFSNNGNINLRIFDSAINIARQPFKTNYSNVERVLFYYTPELPEMMVKQCHIVSKYLHKAENKHIIEYIHALQNVANQSFELQGLNFSGRTDDRPKGEYQRAIVPAIYPQTYHSNFKDVFQCKKAWGTFMNEQHSWFYELHKDAKIYEMMKSDFQSFYKNIDSKYLKDSGAGFKTFSNYYKIGLIENFKITS
jgi:hypothetical protein